MTCKDRSRGCDCYSHMDPPVAYDMYKHQIDDCPLTCKYCFDPKPRDEPASGKEEIEDEEVTSGGSGKEIEVSDASS